MIRSIPFRSAAVRPVGRAVVATIQLSLPLALVLGASLVLAPIALYLAFSDE